MWANSNMVHQTLGNQHISEAKRMEVEAAVDIMVLTWVVCQVGMVLIIRR